jgi:hypothetical protein
MHLVICTPREAYVVNDRRGTLMESIRRFLRVLGRFYPDMEFENCHWRSTLADWQEVDAFLGVPQNGSSTVMAAILEVFVQYFLESANMQRRICKKRPVDLAWGSWRGNDGRLILTPEKSLRFVGQETFAMIRSESIYPDREAVENLDRRIFRGLACSVGKKESGNRRQESGHGSQESEIRAQ